MSRRSRVLVMVLGAALIASLAVGSVTPIGASGPARVHQQASGVLRIAAEQEPDCADWIASCAGASWGNWALGVHTLPKPLEIDDKGEYQPGPMLVDFPTLDPGPPMKVTYRIDPAAVWSDGEPITSTDFQYLWKQITTSKDIYDSTGYTSIESVDTTDPKTAVVTFKEPYAAWKDLFGGFYFLVPSHLLQGKNRNKAMKDGYASPADRGSSTAARRAGRRARASRSCPTRATGATSRRSRR